MENITQRCVKSRGKSLVFRIPPALFVLSAKYIPKNRLFDQPWSNINGNEEKIEKIGNRNTILAMLPPKRVFSKFPHPRESFF